MAILIMGQYAISKLSIILYHKETDLSIGFAKNISKSCVKALRDDAKGLKIHYTKIMFMRIISYTPSSQARSSAPRSRCNRYRAKW